MRKFGNVPPMLIAATPKGFLNYVPEHLEDEKAKDKFINTSRFIITGYQATAAVMILESWMTVGGTDGSRPDSPPSESFEREEVVILAAESFEGHRTEILPIVRSDSGKFFGFGDARKMDKMQGRFAELLPPKPVEPAMSMMARQSLAVMGITEESLKPRAGKN